MKNFVQEGEVLEYLNSGSAITAGSVIDVAGVGCLVAVSDIASGASGSVSAEGVFLLPKAVGAIGFGAKVYWNGTAATTTVGTNTLLGFCTKAALSADASAYVKLSYLGNA